LDELSRRLEKIERMLEDIYRRLRVIEEALGISMEEPILAVVLAQVLELPVSKAVESATRIRRALRLLKTFDPLDRAIVEALSTKEWMTISEITRVVRMIRGKASRTTVRERVLRLEKKGVVEVRRETNRTLVRLRS
jgi:DNA-binding transcriptional ArsR family regulator